jgi:16S rRNA (uracil1498-N3)-methyltransferase
MSTRYFVEEPISPGRLVLAGAEAHHLIHVMRATAGTPVVLFDGSGAEFPAVVQRVGRNGAELSVISREDVSRELPADVTLGVALPKGDRQKWLVEKAVELGVRRIVPLRTRRTVAQPGEQTLLRLRRAVIEASKQCGRNCLLQIDPPEDWISFVDASAGVPCRLLAHPRREGREERGEGRGEKNGGGAVLVEGQSTSIFLAIGPEGGLIAEEVALAVAAGWQTIDLGPRILRVETAAVLLMAMVVQQLA